MNQFPTLIRDTKAEMRDLLVQHATHMLDVARQLRNGSAIPMSAHFQGLDIANAEMAQAMIRFRAILGATE